MTARSSIDGSDREMQLVVDTRDKRKAEYTIIYQDAIGRQYPVSSEWHEIKSIVTANISQYGIPKYLISNLDKSFKMLFIPRLVDREMPYILRLASN